MAASPLPAPDIALVGAPDSHAAAASSAGRSLYTQAMHIEITQDIVDQLLESVSSGKAPQIVFGRTPQLRYGDKTHVLHASPETCAFELYTATAPGRPDRLDFAGLINHTLTVQAAEDATAAVDSALEQLRSSMAAMAEIKEANKTIVDTAPPSARGSSVRHPFPSAGLKTQHLTPSKLGSPLSSRPSSPLSKQRAPNALPSTTRDRVLRALRVPVIHLLATQPATEASLALMCRTSPASMRDLLPKLAKRSSSDADRWQLTDKSFRELDPWAFSYPSHQERQQAIDNAIKSFDRQRLTKEDKLWQILLPLADRGHGLCLSRSKVKAPEPKSKASTPMHKISDLTKKKVAVRKAEEKTVDKKSKPEEKTVDKKPKPEEKTVDKKPKPAKEVEFKPKSIKEKYLARDKPVAKEAREGKEEMTKAKVRHSTTSSAIPPSVSTGVNSLPSHTSHAAAAAKQAPSSLLNSLASRPRSRTSARDAHRDRPMRPARPIMAVNTKPKNPSPLSASPPLNASDFEDEHLVHKDVVPAPSPAKMALGRSDHLLKRKANDTDSDMHNHIVKKAHLDGATPIRTPSSMNGRSNTGSLLSNGSLKRKSNQSSSSDTLLAASQARRMADIDTGLGSPCHDHHSPTSPGASSSSTTSPTMSNLSFRQTVELSQKFQKCYKRYEELYWQLTEAEKAPTDAQRNELLGMHRKLEEMKREIKAGAGMRK